MMCVTQKSVSHIDCTIVTMGLKYNSEYLCVINVIFLVRIGLLLLFIFIYDLEYPENVYFCISKIQNIIQKVILKMRVLTTGTSNVFYVLLYIKKKKCIYNHVI